MILRAPFWTKDHWLALQVFDHDIEASVVEEIADSQSAAYLRNSECRSHPPADIAKGAVVLIEEEKLWLPIPSSNILGIHLGIYVSVHNNQIGPAIIVEVEESIAPTNRGCGGGGQCPRHRSYH